jgi:hypothetical protein
LQEGLDGVSERTNAVCIMKRRAKKEEQTQNSMVATSQDLTHYKKRNEIKYRRKLSVKNGTHMIGPRVCICQPREVGEKLNKKAHYGAYNMKQ